MEFASHYKTVCKPSVQIWGEPNQGQNFFNAGDICDTVYVSFPIQHGRLYRSTCEYKFQSKIAPISDQTKCTATAKKYRRVLHWP